MSDPLIIAPSTDGVLLAIRFAKDGRPASERARDLLDLAGAHVLGVVINGIGLAARKLHSYDGYFYGTQSESSVYYSEDRSPRSSSQNAV